MTAKEYLNQARLLDAWIQAKFKQLQQWRALAEKRTANYTPHPGGSSPIPDRRMDIVAKIVDAERELNVEIDRLVDLKREIEQVIARVPDNRMRLLLEMRYINGAMWKEIAELMGYDRSNIWRLHCAALTEIEKIYEG